MAELKVFTGSPSKEFLEKVESILSLPHDKLLDFNRWAKEHLDLFFEAGSVEVDAREEAQSLGISRRLFHDMLSVIGSLLLTQETEKEPEIDDWISDLQAFGLGKKVASNVRLLLRDIKISPRKARYTRQRAIAASLAIPTLSDLDIICDLRAIFTKFPSPSTTKRHAEEARDLLGFEPIAILRIETNDQSGETSTITLQISEATLRGLLRTLQDGLAQMEIVKSRAPMSTGDNS